MNPSVRPIEPSNFDGGESVCQTPHVVGEDVVAVGMGRFQPDEAQLDWRLRQATFKTISSEDCSNQLLHKLDPNTIICADVNDQHYRTCFDGDSGNYVLLYSYYHLQILQFFRRIIGHFGHIIPIGGPIFQNREIDPEEYYNIGDLVGVISSGEYHDSSDRVKFQIFTNVRYYFRWIEHRTGLRLPTCDGPQADSLGASNSI